MKHLPTIAGAILGLAFITFGLNHFLGFMSLGGGGPSKEFAAPFFGAFKGSGMMDYVKIFEIIGGILVALPKTRNWGLLVLGPILINIIAINIYIKGHGAVFAPPLVILSLLALYLLIIERKKFASLLK